MQINIIKRQDQGKGQFNNGAILEDKPIGFPQDGGVLKPYSNLFYWAHAWTPEAASLIGEHPHKGFEIMSFVLRGSLEHYDNQHQGWRTLDAGDAQIIRSGSGITHAERVGPDSAFFQIWVDPDLGLTLRHKASYDDYPAADFPIEETTDKRIKRYAGEGAPMQMESKGIAIEEITFLGTEAILSLKKDHIYSLFVLNGSLNIDGQSTEKQDFVQVIADADKELPLLSEEGTKVFMISSLALSELPYATYAEQMRTSMLRR